MIDTSEDGFDREDYDHGTDEYVSDCNRLPFSEPVGSASMSKREIVCCALISLAVCAVLCAGAYGLYKLIVALI